jgi:chorismate mutase
LREVGEETFEHVLRIDAVVETARRALMVLVMLSYSMRRRMAAAAAAAYAQKKARDEARRALIISTALNQNMANLDPDTQEQLRALLAAESRRVQQENLDWKIGWWAIGIIFGGLGLVFLLAIAH